MSEAQLLWGLVFSCIGLGYFLYGKKQRSVAPLACGIALMIYPYFVANSYALVAIGAVFTAIPYLLRER